jgi:hypothetical protein
VQMTHPYAAQSFFPLEAAIGDFIVLGSRAVDHPNTTNSGAARLYDRNGTFIDELFLTRIDRDEVGWALAINRNVVLVGAPDHDIPAEDAGLFGIFGVPEMPYVNTTGSAATTSSSGPETNSTAPSSTTTGGMIDDLGNEDDTAIQTVVVIVLLASGLAVLVFAITAGVIFYYNKNQNARRARSIMSRRLR